jgi:competence protein ComEC
MTLVRSGPTSAVVIDTGAPGAGADRCLRRFGVTSIPLLVLTHPHADHDGAVTEVIATASVNQVWVAPVSSDVHAGSAPSAVQSARIPLGVATPGEVWTFGDARVSVLMADPSPASTADSRLNDGSVVVVAESGGVSVLALGDLEEAGQQRLVERLPASLTVDVVKVAHHGSSRQEAALEAALSYAVAVFSVGQGNSFGHPTSQALDLYSDATVLRTDRCGDIALMRTPQLRQWSGCRLGMGG